MKIIYLLLFVLFLHISIVSAIAGGDSVVGFNMSFDGGTGYSDKKSAVFLCQTGNNDLIKTLGSSSDTWGRTWSVDDFSDANFRGRLVLVNQAGSDTLMKVDHVTIKVFYNPPVPVLTYETPTPANNSNIGATLRVNVSSDLDLTSCKLQHNATGSFQNITMTIVGNSRSCFANVFNIANSDNGTRFQYEVFGDAGGGENNTGIRFVNISNTHPNVTINSPLNHTITLDNFIILNVTIDDPENDLLRLFFWGGNLTTSLNENFLSRQDDLESGQYTYNFTSPLIQNISSGLQLLFHLDNRNEFGENDTHVFDFSRNGNNGTISGGGNNATPNITGGYFAGAYVFDNDRDFINVADFTLNSPLTIAVWAKSDSSKCDGASPNEGIIIGLRSGATRNSIIIEGFACDAIWITGEDAALKTTPAGFNHSEWNFYTATSKTDNLTLYLNGELINSGNRIAFNYTAGARIGLGANNQNDFEGHIDEVAIWNRVLSSDEILDLYRLAAGKYFWNVTVTDGEFGDADGGLDFHVLYDEGNLVIDCSERLTLVEDLDGDSGANMTITGNGDFTINGANITGFSDYIFKKDASNICEDFVIVSGRLG